MADLSKEEFLAHIGPMRDDIADLVRLQREQNGRVYRVESRLDVLEDRADSQRSPGKVSATVSAVISGIISGLGVWISNK